MNDRVAFWVRFGVIGTLVIPQLLVGLWALLAPQNFFDQFPGFGPAIVAAEPPYNGHLMRDVGAGFLATGVGLLFAAVWARRAAMLTALVTYAAFTLPHFLWHAANPSEALSGAGDVANSMMLGSGLGLAALFAWGTLRRPVPAAAPQPQPQPQQLAQRA